MGKLKILVGDITSDEILRDHDLLINPTNPRMVCGMGVSQAIFHKAGVEQLERYTQNKYNISYFTEDNLMQVGETRITPGFNLPLDIMFAQGPRVYDYEQYEIAKSMLLKTYENIVEEAMNRGYQDLLIPSLGTGSYGFEHQDIARDVLNLLKKLIQNKEINIDFVLYSEKEKSYYEE